LGLLERADVLTEGFRPGVAERLGIGPAECFERNPRLVYGRLTGWGQDGPLAQAAGHDINYIALSGALHCIGPNGGPPQIPVNLVGDMGGGALYLVIGILAALRERAQSGRGQVVDTSILDGTAQLLTSVHSMIAAGAWREERGVNVLDGGAPFYCVYETSDGGYMAVGAGENKFFANLLKALQLPDDPRQQGQRKGWADLRLRMPAVFRTRTRAEWTAYFEAKDCCMTPVLRPTEAAGHPHLAHRRTLQSRNGILQAAATPRFSRSSGADGDAPPTVGEHSLEILQSLGCTDPDALIARGVVHQHATTDARN
jgi:alpha-methylacyl-CoA racemase